MSTETRLQRYRDADTWSSEESLAAMLDNQMAAFVAVRNALPALKRAVAAVAERLRRGGRLIYTGAGSAGRIALQDGIELYPTFSWPKERVRYLLAGGDAALVDAIEGAEDDAAAAAAAVARLQVSPEDVVIAVAASGATVYTCTVQHHARVAGALTVAMANNPDTPLLQQAEMTILLDTGGEFLAGSTRMCAGTAQKIALNLLSTQTMIELGRVYQGYMVDVVPSNVKLVRRAKGIVQALTGCGEQQSEQLWQQAGGDLKVAVLLGDGFDPERARQRLQAAQGNLRKARIV